MSSFHSTASEAPGARCSHACLTSPISPQMRTAISALRSALATKTYKVNRRDADGDRCPLHWAAARGHTRCAVALLKAGADPTMFEVSSGLTCSELAASRGHEKLAAAAQRQLAHLHLGAGPPLALLTRDGARLP